MTIARKLSAVRAFLRFALGPARVPDASLAPRRGRRLPEALRADEVEQAIDALDGDGALAVRNRALVELNDLLQPTDVVVGHKLDGG